MKIILIIIIFITFPRISSSNDRLYTGLKIPRFLSTKTSESNLRVGAGENYPIILVYQKENIPLEIIEEYYDWRKINDYEGNTGWLHERLLKGNRYVLINTPYRESAQIYGKPQGKIIGKIGNKNIVKIKICLNKWCKITIEEHEGWINKNNLWGVYKDELLNVPFYQYIINQYWKIIK